MTGLARMGRTCLRLVNIPVLAVLSWTPFVVLGLIMFKGA